MGKRLSPRITVVQDTLQWTTTGCSTLFVYRRKILDDNLDEETKAAQKEEMERKQRLLEIQEKLRQQALELRAQREKEMLNNSNMEKLKNSALKSLLEGNHPIYHQASMSLTLISSNSIFVSGMYS